MDNQDRTEKIIEHMKCDFRVKTLDDRLRNLYQNRVVAHACLRQYLEGEISLEESLIRLVMAQDTQAEEIFKMLRDSAMRSTESAFSPKETEK